MFMTIDKSKSNDRCGMKERNSKRYTRVRIGVGKYRVEQKKREEKRLKDGNNEHRERKCRRRGGAK